MRVSETVTVKRLVEDQGTIVVFEGETESGDTVWFGADHRPAHAMLERGLQVDGEPMQVELEPWQVIARARQETTAEFDARMRRAAEAYGIRDRGWE